MRILGVDPGLLRTGYACLDCADGSLTPTVIEAGVFRLTRGASVAQRLVELEHDLADAIERLRPDAAAVETLFSHYKRPTTAVVMGHARGVILLTIQRAGLALHELEPATVKKSLTGAGRASKEQVQRAVQGQLRLPAMPEPPDVADAIAIALCAARRRVFDQTPTRSG
ncbi:MAG: crossover junction endodeoxyribonuclease RuvC [Phycisphaeraceae bacterium]|nr:crossover junction endodeoxyribonuclease RuvC [Phycisphaeraceae bacterium]